MKDQPEMYSVVTTAVKLGRLGKFDNRSQNMRIIYNVYKFSKTLLSNWNISVTNVHKTQETTVKEYSVHHSAVQTVFSEASNSSSHNQILASPRKAYKRKHNVTDTNEFDKGVLCQTVYESYNKREYPTASKLKDYGEQNRIF